MRLNPYNFPGSFEIAGISVQFHEVGERGMGGPVVGHLTFAGGFIKERSGKNALFAGPFIATSDALFGVQVLSLSDSKIVKISADDKRIVAESAILSGMILLDSVQGETISFFTDLENTVRESSMCLTSKR